MSGIYIHIPFCKQKCNYCDFYFSTNLNNKELLVNSIVKEIELRKIEVTELIETIYFGGGTPSLLTGYEWNLLFDAIHKNFNINENAEITIEVNPDDISSETIKLYTSLGVNRLSIGIQSFNEADLQFMNRAHNFLQAENAIKIAQNNGISNISIDLIYGGPTTTNQIWKENLEKAVLLNISHISSYALTVEEKTLLHNQIKNKKIEPLNEEQSLIQFEMLQAFLEENGFFQYEISNFSKPNFQSKHNSNYWKNKPYLGVGPSAHSFNGKNIRSWNVSNNSMYIKSLEKNILPNKSEILSEKDLYNEFVMTGLRKIKGLDLNDLTNLFHEKYLNHILLESKSLIKQNKVLLENNQLSISKNQLFFSDGITAKLFYT